MADQVRELVDLLADPKPEVVLGALSAVGQLLGSDEYAALLEPHSDCLRVVLDHVQHANVRVSAQALAVLINACNHAWCLRTLVGLHALRNVLALVGQRKLKALEYALLLLTNLTRDAEAIESDLDQIDQVTDVLIKLLYEEPTEGDPHRWAAVVLMNLSRDKRFALELLKNGRRNVPLLLFMLESSTVTRRSAALGLFRNLSLLTEEVSEFVELKVLDALAMPLLDARFTFASQARLRMPQRWLRLSATTRVEASNESLGLLLDTLDNLARNEACLARMREMALFDVLREFYRIFGRADSERDLRSSGLLTQLVELTQKLEQESIIKELMSRGVMVTADDDDDDDDDVDGVDGNDAPAMPDLLSPDAAADDSAAPDSLPPS